jgi:L-alanine-DL-glutamate epimerase-like enolase superfamily enzyme
VGFDLAQDIVQIGALSQSLLPAEHLSADANQAWSLDEVVNIE